MPDEEIDEEREPGLDDLPDPSLMPILKTTGGYTLPVSKLVKVMPDDIDEEYRIQASWFTTVCYQTEIREVEIERIERRIKELEAEVYLQLRNDPTVRRPSEPSLKAAVATHTQVKAGHHALYKARKEYVAWNSVKMGLIQKKEMLINLGASRRLDKRSSLSD